MRRLRSSQLAVIALFSWPAAYGKNELKISPASLPDWTIRSYYSQALSANGCAEPCLWSSEGTLPSGLSLSILTGAISGSPGATGTFQFNVSVIDSKLATGSQAYSLVIHDAPRITTAALPAGIPGTAYSQVVAVSNGTPPDHFSVTAGSLPPGLSLDASAGTIQGTPGGVGSFAFTITVSDAAGAAASQAYNIIIDAGSRLAVNTPSPLPAGIVGAAYSQTLSAAGGRPPYSWSVNGGALPEGLTLNSTTGLISGSPSRPGSFIFNAHITDSALTTADKSYSMTISPVSAIPVVSVSGLAGTTNSGLQLPFDVTISAPYSKAITGQVTLSVQPSPAPGQDDPSIQFSSGGRALNFTIAAGSTHATFPANPIALQTGTIAGIINLSVSSDLPGGTASMSIVIPRAGPVLRSATIVPSGSGFQVQVAGFSNSRDLTAATFHFTAKSGQVLKTSDLTVNLASLASQWYAGSASRPFGGQFLLVVPFTVEQGAVSSLSSLQIQLQNSQSSSTMSANF